MSAIYLSSVGADLDQIEPHTRDVQRAIEEMNQKLPNETRILEGTTTQSYAEVRSALENELSQPKLTEEQWKNVLQSGSSTIDPTPISTQDSSNSSCIADLFNRGCPIVRLRSESTHSPTSSCSGNSAASGNEIDAMNESSECTVPMTSELMLGMPNEAR